MSALNSITLDKNTPVPLYYQLKKQLLGLIESSRIGEGELLPPEKELCKMLEVSRPTIRQAFGELVNEGYLSRHKGKGTFVSRPRVECRFFSRLETFNEEMAEKGFKPGTAVLALEKINGPHEAGGRLSLPVSAPLIYLSRLRSADSVPLVYVETFIPHDAYHKLMLVDFRVNSLYDSLETLYQVRINRVRREFTALNARRKEADLLQIGRNRAVCLVKTTAFSGDTPVEFSIARYRGGVNRFGVELFR